MCSFCVPDLPATSTAARDQRRPAGGPAGLPPRGGAPLSKVTPVGGKIFFPPKKYFSAEKCFLTDFPRKSFFRGKNTFFAGNTFLHGFVNGISFRPAPGTRPDQPGPVRPGPARSGQGAQDGSGRRRFRISLLQVLQPETSQGQQAAAPGRPRPSRAAV